MTTTHAKPLKALAKYFDITERGEQYEIKCKACRKGWGCPVSKSVLCDIFRLYLHIAVSSLMFSRFCSSFPAQWRCNVYGEYSATRKI
jgi:hypothetical protein